VHTDTESKARAGVLNLSHGSVQTPIFMPVGTQGAVKAMSVEDLNACNAQIILGNTYHLYLRPGTSILEKFGGLHKFNTWEKPILTDSGGYQVFSLKELRKLSEEGAKFQSHIDGSYHMFTPENVVDIQRKIGSDIMMLLDECPAGDAEYNYVKKSNELTIRWAIRGRKAFLESEAIYGHKQEQFGIIQGGVFEDIRKDSAERLIEMDFEGYAIGGLSVGEKKEDMYRVTNFTTDHMPIEKARYLMGVGKPEDIIHGIEYGIDMFDCVLPTRNARNGTLYTYNGQINIKRSQYKEDESALDELCNCITCKKYSKGYLNHLFKAGELLYFRLASIHNIYFYMDLVNRARKAILENKFLEWKKNFLDNYYNH
jgi:queuine tRNA-ribosyltransferase